MISLNPAQKQAVEITDNNLLVLSGAGSGKTRVITAKIIYLLQKKKISPYNILAITFTNKAAQEMRSRVINLVGNLDRKLLWIRTFHSFGARLLRFYINLLPPFNTNFTILDPDDQKRIIKEIIKTKNFDLPLKKIRSILDYISYNKSYFRYPDKEFYSLNSGHNSFPGNQRFLDIYHDIYTSYYQYCVNHNFLDYDDLISFPVRLLEESEEVKKYVNNRWKYVLIDEYQDTNLSQEILIKHLSDDSILTAVGDDDQSIYSFRGSTTENIRNFHKNYKNVKVIKLEQNYRSTKNILQLANNIISHNNRVFEKILFTQKEGGVLPELHLYTDEKAEARSIVDKIIELKKDHISEENIVILYRTNHQSRVFEERLRNNNISYKIIGGFQFYRRKEIKDLMAYILLAWNKKDDNSLLRIINVPQRKIGKKTLEKILNHAHDHNISALEALEELNKHNSFTGNLQKKTEDFAAMISRFSQQLAIEEKPHKYIKNILEKSGLLSAYQQIDDPIERDERTGNLFEFVSAAADYEKENPGSTLIDFIENVLLRSDQDDIENNNCVTLMTFHNAKGLEYPVVFVTGLEEELFPHLLSSDTIDGIEEERRLFYVAVTRAQERVFLSASRERRVYGYLKPSRVSRFLTEIDESTYKMFDYSYFVDYF